MIKKICIDACLLYVRMLVFCLVTSPYLLFIWGIIACCGCGLGEALEQAEIRSNTVAEVVEEKTYHNVVRVFMHLPYQYTLLMQDPESNKIEKICFFNNETVDIFADAPKHTPMYAIHKKSKMMNGQTKEFLEVHIHSADDISGAGFRTEGKHGVSGQTNSIE